MKKLLLLFWFGCCASLLFPAVAKPDNNQAAVVVLSTDFVLPGKFSRLAELAQQQDIRFHYLYTGIIDEQLATAINNSSMLILDGPRPSDMSGILAQLQQILPDGTSSLKIPWLQIGGGRPAFGNLAAADARQLISLYSNGGLNNFRHFFAHIAALTSGQPAPKVTAEPFPAEGIYHPDTVFTDLTSYLNHLHNTIDTASDKPMAGFIITSSQIKNMQTTLPNAIFQAGLKQGIIPVLFWFDDNDPQALTRFWGENLPVAMINLTHMQQGELRIAEFTQLKRPVLQAFIYREGNEQHWRNASSGLSAGTASTLMMIPEGWGMSDPLVIAALDNGEAVAIDSQLNLLFEKLHSLWLLQQFPAAEKHLALLFWNTPDGAENISASNLNVPASLVKLTTALAEAGYSIPVQQEQQVIDSARQLLNGLYQPDTLLTLVENNLAQTLSLSDYINWFETLPTVIRQEVNNKWGQPGQHALLRKVNNEAAFIFPAASWGNLLLMPQPPRAGKAGVSTHDTKVPPDHYYLAAYYFLQQQQLNALIHFGTHGTQEWTPGKDRGLADTDYPFLALGELPVFYPYIQDNIGEALQARRRGRAVTISHQTPPFAPSGLYAELTTLHDLLHQYEQLSQGAVKDATASDILALVAELGLDKDIGFDRSAAEQNFDDFYLALHEHLHLVASAIMPLGLHTFGEAATTEERLLTVLQQLGTPFYQALGEDAAELLTKNIADIKQSQPFVLLQQVLTAQQPLPEDADLAAMLTTAQQYYQHLSAPNETEALLKALNGEFIPAGLGGDPVRNPQSSSGTNLYGFDPLKIPTPAAYEAAKGEYEKLLASYQEEHGRLPQKLAFSLWSSEALRHLGVVEAQVLHALGLKPVWSAGGRLTALSIIPEHELSRPRVDVVLQLTSVYRDQFDGFMRLLAQAITELAQQNDDNAIARNSRLLAQQLMQQGQSAEQAQQLSVLRLFSNEPGDYGSGVTAMALNSTSWDSSEQVADQFMTRLQYVYGPDIWGEKPDNINLFAEQLKNVDAAVMSRSTNLHGLLSTDHPFEFLGGLSAAIKKQTGKAPALFINDLRQSDGRVVSAGRYLSEELRSRYLNPQWIEGMKNEGYAGALEMLSVTNNLFGWQVMAPEIIREDQWQAMHDVYIADKYQLQLNDWFSDTQPAAQMQIIERMTEAIRKGYWDADEETQKSLASRYQQLQQLATTHQGNAITTAVLEKITQQYGLSEGSPTPGQGQLVSGQEMREVSTATASSDIDYVKALIWLFILAIFVSGIWRQYRQQRVLAAHSLVRG